MLIIIGYRVVERVTDKGNFICPSCDVSTACTRVFKESYFTICAIPIYREDLIGEVIRCSDCTKEFPAKYYELTKNGLFKLSTWNCPECKTENLSVRNRCKGCRYLVA